MSFTDFIHTFLHGTFILFFPFLLFFPILALPFIALEAKRLKAKQLILASFLFFVLIVLISCYKVYFPPKITDFKDGFLDMLLTTSFIGYLATFFLALGSILEFGIKNYKTQKRWLTIAGSIILCICFLCYLIFDHFETLDYSIFNNTINLYFFVGCGCFFLRSKLIKK